MEVQPVVKHQSADKWVKKESQPADKVSEKHNPFMGLWGRDDLSLGWEPVGDFLGQISSLLELGDVLLLDAGGRPLALRSGSRHGWSAFLGRKG